MSRKKLIIYKMKKGMTVLVAILFVVTILSSCGGKSKSSGNKGGSQSKICKCMEESAKGSTWYQDHEYECIELSNSGQRCND
jgi:hypothetical protein